MVDNLFWRKDECLKEEVLEDNKLKLLSLDVFDTLIFRRVYRPEDLFVVLGKKLNEKKIIRDGMTPFEFKEIRKLAEKKARELNKAKNLDEVNLIEIYRCMPSSFNNLNEMMKLEIETEKEICYLNPSIISLIKYVVSKGIKIVLISDMYLASQEIKEILVHNGLNLELIDKVFVSNEFRKTKSSGELFQEVLKYYNIEPKEIIHIGDNESADIIGAEKENIKSIFYNVTNYKDNSSFELEKYKYGQVLPELLSLRKLAGNLCNDIGDEKEKFWYKFGAEVLGPFFTLFTEWIVKIAQRENKAKIYPLMREGKIFSTLIKNSLEYKNISIEVKPMYVSRRAVFLAGINEFNKEVIDEICQKKSYTIGHLFELFKIEHGNKFNNYLNVKINDSYNMKHENIVLKEYLISFFMEKSNISKINKNINFEKYKLRKYLESNFINKNDFITVDIGYRGTMQKVINDNSKVINSKLNITHLLAIGEEENRFNLFEDIDIRGFIGSAGENLEIIKIITREPAPLEAILTGSEQTTIGYDEINDEIVPVLGENHLSEEEKKLVYFCHRGILEFQNLFLNYFDKEIVYEKEKPAKLLTRFFEAPTFLEAYNIGEFHQENKFDGDNIFKFCNKEDEILLDQLGIEKFILNSFYNKIVWPQGVIAKKYPNYFLKKAIDENSGISDYLKISLTIGENIRNNGFRKVIIYGAGEVGKNLIRALKMCDIQVSYIVDRNQKLWGDKVDGIEVVSLKEAISKDIHTFAIGSFAFIDEIIDTIEKEYVNECSEVSIFSIKGKK